MTETIIVGLIVGTVLALAVRSIYKTLTGENTGCSGCSSSCQQCTEILSEKPGKNA